MDSLEKKKAALLDRLERLGYISDPLVRRAMEKVPREAFVPVSLKGSAYEDRPLPIGNGQTISAPHMNAMMCSGLELKGTGKIKLLEIGTGSGYHATLCGEILRQLNAKENHVYTVERIKELALEAREKIKKLGYDDIITVIHADGTLGYEPEAPYNRILVTAAAPAVPSKLIEQLDEGGIMLIPVGEKHAYQELVRIRKEGGKLKRENICGVAFVPLIGKDGFKG